MKESKLLLHAGGVPVSIDEIANVATPEPTDTHFPVPHKSFVETVIRHVSAGGYNIVDSRHALSHNGQRYFGLLLLETTGMDGAYQWALGLRNSHDKKFKAEITAGSRVFVCDNLAFSGTVKAVRKHTRYVERDMQGLVSKAIGKLGDYFAVNDDRYSIYKSTELSENEFGGLIVSAIEARVIPVTRVPDLIKEWRNPRHEEFRDRTVWSLFNATTHVFKSINDPAALMTKNTALHGLLDTHCGIAFT